MDIRRKFNFDDPEDSYWNETAKTSKESQKQFYNLFDGPSTSEQNLSETKNLFPKENDNVDIEFSGALNKWIDVSLNDIQSISDKSSIPDNFKEIVGIDSKRKETFCGSSSIISDCSLNSSEVTVHLDYARLRSEHKKLQKHFELFYYLLLKDGYISLNIRQERFRPLPVVEAIKRLQNCQPISLDLYKTNAEKLSILGAALNSLDHDVIVAVILFLKRTLTNSIFCEILITNCAAADHYVLYLKECHNINELVDTLFALGRSDEAAMIEFSEACRLRQPKMKVQALKQCLISGFSVPVLQNEIKYVQEYIDTIS